MYFQVLEKELSNVKNYIIYTDFVQQTTLIYVLLILL